MCQNLGHLQTAISQARNKLLTNFQRLQSTTRHGHMVCVQKSDMGTGFVWKNPLQFYPAGLIRINPTGKSQKNPPEGGFFQKTAEK